MVIAGKKEWKVIIYMTGSAEVRSAVVKAFGDAFGITVEAITGSGRELSERLIRERKAGLRTTYRPIVLAEGGGKKSYKRVKLYLSKET